MSGDATAPVPKDHDDESSSASSEEEDEDEEEAEEEAEAQEPPVESLVLGRSRRVTAGNRLSSLLQQEGDDELELLFAEDEEEEDIEFEGNSAEDASDVQLDSSSDEEDQGPAKVDDDLEGEKELQKQDRAEQRRKRKAQGNLMRPGLLRKKAKVDPAATEAQPSTPAPRSRKKSERINWLPTVDEGPTRSSSRKQTVENKTLVHERMKENERRRIKQIKVMETAAKRKEASKPKAMTQADRMAEAARMEKKNAKSLNRWEETEKKRAEEQRAKLEALHNRQLSGPVITWWSGLARWVNGKLGQVGIRAIRALEEVEGDPKTGKTENTGPDQILEDHSNNVMDRDTAMADVGEPQPPASALRQPNHAPSSQQEQVTPSQGPCGFLDGIHYYASLPAPSPQAREPPKPVSGREHAQDVPPLQPSTELPTPVVEYSCRNLVNLGNIDANALKLAELQNHILLKKRNGKPPSKQTRWDHLRPEHLANRVLQNRCKSPVPSPTSPPDFAIPKPDCLMRIHMLTRRSSG